VTILIALAVLGLLIFVHELGHFIAAKRADIRVEEFALGFGPRVLSVIRGETRYSLRAMPIGGFVRMSGTSALEGPVDHRGFINKGIWQRLGVLLAGPAMNFVLAILLFAIIFSILGIEVPTLQLAEVLEGHAAERSGFLRGDRVISVDGIEVQDWAHLVTLINASLGEEVVVVVERGGSQRILRVVPEPRPDDPSRGFIGISPDIDIVRQNPFTALKNALGYTLAVSVLWIRGLVLMILGKAQVDVAGPVGITQLIGEASKMGLRSLMYLSAALSANLGILNLLPIPALDGSRLAFLLVEGVRGKPVDPEKENLIHFLGFALLMIVAIVVTYRDILRWGAS